MRLKSRMKSYCEHSTIKCLPRIMRAKSQIHKLLWVITFVVGACAAGYLLSGLWTIYFSYAKTLSQRTERTELTEFPDVTLCNMNPLWFNRPGWGIQGQIEGIPGQLTYNQYIMTLFYAVLADRSSGEQVFAGTDPEYYSLSGFLKHSSYTHDDLMELSKMFIWKCIWESERKIKDCVVNATIDPDNGLCYTLRPPEGHGMVHSERQEGLSVMAFMNAIDLRFVADYRMSPFASFATGVKVMLHAQGTAPDMSHAFTVAPGTEASVVAQKVKRILLPEPYGSCSKTIDLGVSGDHTSGSKHVWNYTEKACKSLCYQNHVIQKCGCLDSTELVFEELKHKYDYCTYFSMINMQQTYDTMNCSRTAKDDAEAICTENCVASCETDTYSISVNQVPWPNEIYILGFYYAFVMATPPSPLFSIYDQAIHDAMSNGSDEAWAKVRSTRLIQENFLQVSVTIDHELRVDEDKPAITIEGIVGNLGGIMNLWIGFTFITVIEFFDLFLSLIMEQCWGRQLDEKEQQLPDVTRVEPFGRRPDNNVRRPAENNGKLADVDTVTRY